LTSGSASRGESSLIPTDRVLLDAKDFYVNQAVLTGEQGFLCLYLPSLPPSGDSYHLGERERITICHLPPLDI
jgi:hypothetical protein